MLSIDSDFPGGRIDVVGSTSTGVLELELTPDACGRFRQWFAFRVAGDEAVQLAIVNASQASFAGGWSGYRAMARAQRGRWFRADTEFDGETLTISHRPASDRPIRYAYFAPYSNQRLRSLLDGIEGARGIEVGILGASAMGRPTYVVHAGDGPRSIWIVARQHPGESPSSFAIEGLLRRLALGNDATVAALLRRATLHVVPLLNVDGVELAHTRTSATGQDLNRAWDDPERAEAPEVGAVLEAMHTAGVDAFIDVHADECSPYAFAACSEGNPNYGDAIAQYEAGLRDSLAAHTAEFYDEPFYGLDDPFEADLSCASGQVGVRFECPSITLELPIKDCGDERVAEGWSPERALRFGGALVDVLDSAEKRGW